MIGYTTHLNGLIEANKNDRHCCANMPTLGQMDRSLSNEYRWKDRYLFYLYDPQTLQKVAFLWLGYTYESPYYLTTCAGLSYTISETIKQLLRAVFVGNQW